MLTQDRYRAILDLLEERNSVTVSELTKLLDSSESTIRRDLSSLGGGIGAQLIEADGVIEDGAKLVVNGLEINRRIGLDLLVLVIHHLILPGDDLLSRDFTHF